LYLCDFYFDILKLDLLKRCRLAHRTTWIMNLTFFSQCPCICVRQQQAEMHNCFILQKDFIKPEPEWSWNRSKVLVDKGKCQAVWWCGEWVPRDRMSWLLFQGSPAIPGNRSRFAFEHVQCTYMYVCAYVCLRSYGKYSYL